ncbi:MAG: hypothetical protein ACFCAD_06015 [Pleurocapsa sp.]
MSLGYYIYPENKKTPTDFVLIYQSDRIAIDWQEWIATWRMKSSNVKSKGTVIFHRQNNRKSSPLNK